MKRYYICAVVVLLVCIALVCVSPNVDLSPTALRASRAAALVFLSLVAAVHLSTKAFSPSMAMMVRFPDLPECNQGCDLNAVTLNCSRLC